MPEALERLINLYVAGREKGESATSFFMRVVLSRVRVKAVLGDLKKLTPDAALPDDYIDLAESGEFDRKG